MASLSVTNAWNETTAFVKAEARLLFPLAFMLIALPASLVRALTPPVAEPGQMPPPGPWLAVLALGSIAALVGYLAISYLALRSKPSVGEALTQSGRRLLPLLAASILVSCAMVALLVMLSLVASIATLGAAAGSGRTPGNAELGRAVLVTLLLALPLLCFFFGRLMLMPPAAAAEPGGPFTIIARSWRLTRGYSLKLAAFVMLLFAVVLVLQIAVEAVLGSLFILAAGPAAPGSPSAILILLVMAALSTVIATYVGTLIARVYAQLAADRPGKGR